MNILEKKNFTNNKMYSIIIPTYNESENIAICVYLIFKHLKSFKFEIIIVDDNSPDGTQSIVKTLQGYYGSDKILLAPRKEKLGLGSAYIHGLKYCRGEYVFIMDADLSHHVILDINLLA